MIVADDQRNWDLYIFLYIFCVQYCWYTPGYLEFGRELRLLNDMEPVEDDTRAASHTKYMLSS
jgi:hypothetical protein